MLVFVYGSLLSGLGNHSLVDGCKFVGEGTVDGLAMRSLGAFPGAFVCECATICGELYVVDSDTADELDHLEGHPDFYEREIRDVETADGKTVKAWVYLLESVSCDVRFPVVPNGDWKAFLHHRTRLAMR